jgi:TrmH family RNA methyltransferase
VIVEGLEKPGNLGAVLRSADAAGVTGIILCDNQIDGWNPNVIRASQGACFTVPLAVASTAVALAWLHQAAIRILAATPTASQFYTQVDMRGPCALVFGAEHHGLSEVWQHETLLRIPMVGQVDSLNVAQAASILIFEAVRQRHLP